MAREVVVQKGGEPLRFSMSKVDRAKLYKRRKRVPLGPDGEPCARAQLTSDGDVLVVSGMTAQGYFTEDGYWVPNGELVGLDDEGAPVEAVPSTLGVPQELEGPVNPSLLLDVRVKSVYVLELKESADDALLESLGAGDVYRFPFAYRDGYDQDDAFLVQNLEGDTFAVVGRCTEPAWQDAKAIVPVIEDDDDDEFDFDFESF